jgi:histidine phosphotransferase ChpT
MNIASKCNLKELEEESFSRLSGSVNNYNKGIRMSTRFCELLCAKFCHDMAGPIGAINNGIDFIESENADMKKVAVNLVKTSSKRAINNLTFLRQAYGFTPKEVEVSFYTMKTLINNYLKETKMNCEIVKGIKSEVVDGWTAKLIYNLAIMTSALMMYVGDLKITFGKNVITVTSTAPMHKIDKDLEALFDGPEDPSSLTTRNIQIAFASLIAKDLGYKIIMKYTKPDLLVLTLKKPQ